MIRSLQDLSEDANVEADIHIVGAGISGILIATQLAKRGFRVVVTESGSEQQIEDTHPLNAVEQLGSVYKGAELGRARCLGGTSTRWGGAMIPFLSSDVGEDSGWTIPHSELVKYIPEIEALFGLPAGPYEEPPTDQLDGLTPASYIGRAAKWPAFGRRNVASLFKHQLESESGAEIWLNATVNRFTLSDGGGVKSVVAQASNGRKLTVTAREVVLAAGAIESTRLLLLIDRHGDSRVFSPDDILGRYFHDHLSVCVAKIEPLNRKALNRATGFRFEGTGMRNLRFELSEAHDVRSKVSPCFAHISFVGGDGGGFDTLRQIARLLQQRRPPSINHITALAKNAPWLARAAWWRLREHRLLYPDDAKIEVHMVVEQEPRPENRISLSKSKIDRYGQPLAAIDWRVSTQDKKRLTSSTDLFVDFWKHSSLTALGEIRRREDGEAEIEMEQGGGIYHPGGSTRMANSPLTGVLNSDLRTFRIPNLSVAATSAFPTGGGANPTMMLMMAALRLADHLSSAK